MSEKYNCIECNESFNVEDMILFHELKDVYDNIFGKMYRCKECDKKIIEKIKSEKEEREKQSKLMEEEYSRLSHDTKYDSIINKKIVDVVSNKNNETYIIMENGIKLCFSSKDDDGNELINFK